MVITRVEPGVYVSADGRWRFLRHNSDPKPQRWFAYFDGHEQPLYDTGATSLRDAVDDAQRWMQAHRE